MIAELKSNDKIKFKYVKNRVQTANYPFNRVNYEVNNYEGVVLEIRDLDVDNITAETAFRAPSIERSRYLITVQTTDNMIKSFYSGRVLDLSKIVDKPRSFLRRALDKVIN